MTPLPSIPSMPWMPTIPPGRTSGGGGIPSDCILDETGAALLDESGGYILEG
jgi:hypothetical protein